MAWKSRNPKTFARSNKPKKQKYTAEQKKAYHSGMGYAVRHDNRGIDFSSKAMRASFDAGYKAGCASVRKSPNKYPKLK